jgi:hypothetical protein
MQKYHLNSILSEIVRQISIHEAKFNNENDQGFSRYDKNSKRITVTYDFDYGGIRNVKLIASSEEWLQLEFLDPKKIGYRVVDRILSRRTQNRKRLNLMRYAKELPDQFCQDVLVSIGEASKVNPLCVSRRKQKKEQRPFWLWGTKSRTETEPLWLVGTKPRGGSPYGFSKGKMHQIRSTARHWYIFLGEHFDKKTKAYRRDVDHLLHSCGLNGSAIESPLKATMNIIQRVFGFKIDNPSKDVETHHIFYRKYIALTGRPSLNSLRKTMRIRKGQTPLIACTLAHLKTNKNP